MHLPLPKCARIIPYVNTEWNNSKSVSDVTTKKIDSADEYVTIRTPRSLCVARILCLNMINYHVAHNVLTTKNDTENFYKTTRHWRDACSHRMTYSDAMERIKDCCVAEMIKYRQAIDVDAVSLLGAAASPEPAHRSRRNVVHTIKKIGHRIKQGLTPGKRKQSVDQLELSKRRNDDCLGVSLVDLVVVEDETSGRIKKEYRTKCSSCGGMAQMYCTGCGRHFCINKDRMKQLVKAGVISLEDSKKLTAKIPVYDLESKEWIHRWCRRSCYHIAHEDRWERYWQEHNEAEERDEVIQSLRRRLS